MCTRYSQGNPYHDFTALGGKNSDGNLPLTKKELSQLYYLNREIEEQQRRLQELEALATSCTSWITGMPKNKGVIDRLARYVAEITDLKSLLELNLKKCFYELNRLTRYINSVEDSQLRMILSLRYINGQTWQQIAFSIGEHDEQYPRRKHNAFLQSNLTKMTKEMC